MRFVIFCFFFSITILLNAEKVLIITSAYNRPDFIEIQHKTFQKFLKDEYEFIVFNDASNRILREKIRLVCQNLGLLCVDIPQEIHDRPYLQRFPHENKNSPPVRNANVVQYALNHSGFKHNGIVTIVDSDMFLVKDFSIKEYMKGYQISGVSQTKKNDGISVDYLWIGLVFLDMAALKEKEMINFNCGIIKGVPVDSGGFSYYYLEKYPETLVRNIPHLFSPDLSCKECIELDPYYPCIHNRGGLEQAGADETQIAFIQAGLQNIEIYMRGLFFHYRSGSNWDNKSNEYHKRKTCLFNEYIEKILKP